MKNKPFLSTRGSRIYIGTVILAQPYWIFEIYANFAYFNGGNRHFFHWSRPFEAVFRYVDILIQVTLGKAVRC
jgi:hypothetical protein